MIADLFSIPVWESKTTLAAARIAEDRHWQDLSEALPAAHARAWSHSVHRLWLDEVLDAVRSAGFDWQLANYFASRLRRELREHELYAHEADDVRGVIRRLDAWAAAAKVVCRLEADTYSATRMEVA